MNHKLWSGNMDSNYLRLSYSCVLKRFIIALEIIDRFFYSFFLIFPPLIILVVLFENDVICTIHYIFMIFVIQMTLVISWFLAYFMSIFPIWKKFQPLTYWPIDNRLLLFFCLKNPLKTYRRLLGPPSLGPFSLWYSIFTKSKILAFRHGQVSKGKNLREGFLCRFHHFVIEHELSIFHLRVNQNYEVKNVF